MAQSKVRQFLDENLKSWAANADERVGFRLTTHSRLWLYINHRSQVKVGRYLSRRLRSASRATSKTVLARRQTERSNELQIANSSPDEFDLYPESTVTKGHPVSRDSTMEQDTTEKIVAWNSDTAYALGLYKIITSILGIWPPKCQDVFSKFRIATLAFLQISMMASFIGEVNTDCSSINDIVEVISLLSCAILSLLKVLVLRVFRPKMLDIVNSSIADWSSVSDERARGIMRSHAKIGRSVCIFQMTSAYVTTIPMIVAALPFLAPETINVTASNLSDSSVLRGLPLRTVCIFGDMSDVIYALVFTLQALQLLATCTGNIGNDVYFFGITMHLCGQFQLLGEDLEGFRVDLDECARRSRLGELIRRHVKLSQLAQNLEDSFNFIILVQLSANAFQMCLMVIYVMTLQLYLYSYAGDRLSSQIEKLRVSAYFFPWYEFPPRLGRDVLFVMMRNHRTFSITAGKVYRIDIDNFKNLIKALGSYFSVLEAKVKVEIKNKEWTQPLGLSSGCRTNANSRPTAGKIGGTIPISSLG